MFETIFYLLQSSGDNSAFVVPIIEFFNQLGEANLKYIDYGLAIIIWLLFLFNLLFKKYRRSKYDEDGNVDLEINFKGFIKKTDNLIALILGTLLIIEIIGKGFGIDIIFALLIVTQKDVDNSDIAAFFNGYDNTSSMYIMYGYIRNIIFWIILGWGLWNYLDYHSIGNSRSFSRAKKAFGVLIFMWIICYSSGISTILNWSSMKLTGQTFKEYMLSSTDKTNL